MTDQFDFGSVFGDDAELSSPETVHFLELDHDQFMILVSALHSQWPGGGLEERLVAAQMCHSRIQEMSKQDMLLFTKKLIAFHNNFHKE